MFYTEQQTTGIKIIKENATRFFTQDAEACPGVVY
jgi:hypothetical protein